MLIQILFSPQQIRIVNETKQSLIISTILKLVVDFFWWLGTFNNPYVYGFIDSFIFYPCYNDIGA